MDTDIDDDREENKEIGFILVDSLKEQGVLDTNPKMGSGNAKQRNEPYWTITKHNDPEWTRMNQNISLRNL